MIKSASHFGTISPKIVTHVSPIDHCTTFWLRCTLRADPADRARQKSHGINFTISRTKGDFPMFARILEFVPLMEKKNEFIRVVKKEVLPILKTQEVSLEISPLCPRSRPKKCWRSLSGPTKRSLSATRKSGTRGLSRFSNPI